MTKKDYQAIARAIYVARTAARADEVGQLPVRLALSNVVQGIGDYAANDSPRFDRARFIEACETGTCKGMVKADGCQCGEAYGTRKAGEDKCAYCVRGVAK